MFVVVHSLRHVWLFVIPWTAACKASLSFTIFTLMSTAALFTIARTWKQPRCPLTDGWIKKSWYMYKMEYCLATEGKKFELVLVKWKNLEPVIWCEVSQKEKNKYHILTHVLEKAMATHSSTLAWRVPWTREPGVLPSTVSHRVGHDWSDLAAAAATHIYGI